MMQPAVQHALQMQYAAASNPHLAQQLAAQQQQLAQAQMYAAYGFYPSMTGEEVYMANLAVSHAQTRRQSMFDLGQSSNGTGSD